MSGGASGTGRRGGLAAVDDIPAGGGVSWPDFRKVDPGSFASASTRVQLAGLHYSIVPDGIPPNVGEQTSGGMHGGAAQILYAIPQYFNVEGRISRLLCKIAANAAAGGLCRLAIYDNASDSDPYPGSKLADSGDLDASLAGVKGGAVTVNFDSTDLLWFVYINNASFQTNGTTLLAMRPAQMYPILGSQLTDSFAVANDKDSFGVAWRHAFAWDGGVLPSEFPSSAPVVIGQAEAGGTSVLVPAIYYGWNRA